MSSDESGTRDRILRETWKLMELKRGQGIRIEDVARASGISRQAVYLHFRTRAELLIATARYVDEVNQIGSRLADFRQAHNGPETLRAYIQFWGNYIPEIYGLAKALMSARETDQAATAAWNDRMDALREGCRCVVNCLEREGRLAADWSNDSAVDIMWGVLSIPVWEALIFERGWSQSQYLGYMEKALGQILVKQKT